MAVGALMFTCACGTSLDATETLCSNGLDDDGDKRVDCADLDCQVRELCRIGGRVGVDDSGTSPPWAIGDGGALDAAIDGSCGATCGSGDAAAIPYAPRVITHIEATAPRSIDNQSSCLDLPAQCANPYSFSKFPQCSCPPDIWIQVLVDGVAVGATTPVEGDEAAWDALAIQVMMQPGGTLSLRAYDHDDTEEVLVYECPLSPDPVQVDQTLSCGKTFPTAINPADYMITVITQPQT